MYAFKRFMKMKDSSAKTLHACVRTRHYEKITGTLDKMTLPEGTKLMVNECEKYDRAVSHLYLSDERTDFENQDIFKSIAFEDSCAGAWQAYLQDILLHCLPLFWHANYSRRFYIF